MEYKDKCEHYFALLYHPNDKRNLNKFKLKHVKNGVATLYLKPRNDMIKYIFGREQEDLFTDFQMSTNQYIDTYKYYNNRENIGGPRLLWNINENSYKYVLPCRTDLCGCSLDKDTYVVYTSHSKNITEDIAYRTMKAFILSKFA